MFQQYFDKRVQIIHVFFYVMKKALKILRINSPFRFRIYFELHKHYYYTHSYTDLLMSMTYKFLFNVKYVCAFFQTESMIGKSIIILYALSDY